MSLDEIAFVDCCVMLFCGSVNNCSALAILSSDTEIVFPVPAVVNPATASAEDGTDWPGVPHVGVVSIPPLFDGGGRKLS